MAPNSKTHQQLLISKRQISKLKKLSEKTRYPMTALVDFSIAVLLNNPEMLDDVGPEDSKSIMVGIPTWSRS